MTDSMHEIETTGKTVEEALALALEQLGVAEEDVEVEVLSESSRGLLGIFGQTEARIRVTCKTTFGDKAVELARQMLALLEMEAELRIEAEDAESVQIDIDAGDDTGLIIGRRGETIAALQHLVALLANKGREHKKRVLLNAGGYLERREQALRELAERSANKVRTSGRPVTLEALSSRERRIIHVALADRKDVVTASVGVDPNRRVIISPAHREPRPAEPAPREADNDFLEDQE
jgi:spoIIIJ-associated protein